MMSSKLELRWFNKSCRLMLFLERRIHPRENGDLYCEESSSNFLFAMFTTKLMNMLLLQAIFVTWRVRKTQVGASSDSQRCHVCADCRVVFSSFWSSNYDKMGEFLHWSHWHFQASANWFFLFCRPLSWIVCYCKCLKCVRLYRPDSVVFSALATATINTYRRIASMLLKFQHYIGQFSHGQESSSLPPRVHWVQMPLPYWMPNSSYLYFDFYLLSWWWQPLTIHK